MASHEHVQITRDVAAIQIPDGTPITLAAATPVIITQALGGTYTVMTPYGGLARVDEKDADALGKEVAALTPAASATADAPGELPLEDKVWGELKKCYDPEIPVNIVDLGLVYDCRVEPPADPALSWGQKVTVKMTLTAPGCGMGDVLAQDVRKRVEALAGVSEVDVELVFDPQWSMEMMTEAARLQLGFL